MPHRSHRSRAARLAARLSTLGALAALGVPTLDAQPVRKDARPAPPGAPAGARDSSAATPAAAALAPADRVPNDPAVRTGTLPNGLRYYVRANGRPEQRAALRLVVNAGSVLEDDDQRGLAHFLEHMAFNGTRRFERNALVNYLEKAGVRFGPHLNAYTSFDETVYMLEVPTDRGGVLDTAVQILADWATGIAFDSAEVARERGVVLEEWRGGQGAQQRVFDTQRPVFFAGSRYAERLPIGDTATIRTADVARLRRFYRDWYRPDLMAVVAVGDFDPAAVEARIRREFGPIPAARSPRPRPSYQVPDHDSTLVAIATDPELTTSTVGVLYKLPVPPSGTAADWRRDVVEQLYAGMLNARLEEIAQRPDAPFLGAGTGQGRLVRTREVTQIGAAVKEGEAARGLEAVLTEARRVDQFGFTATELEREKQDLLRAVERAYAERDRTASASFVGDYVEHFLTGEPYPSLATQWALTRQLVPSITLDEVNQVARAAIGERNRVLAASAPAKPNVPAPTADALRAALARAASAPVTAYADQVSDAPLVAQLPPAGRVTSTRTHADVGVTEWTLSNGVRVLLKPTDFKADEVRFTAFSPGGSSLVSDSATPSASLASIIVQQGGLGSFPRVELQKKLAGKAASAAPYLSLYSEGLSGQASPRDLETLFQLIHLTVTAPRADTAAFQALKAQIGAFVANRGASPEQVFGDTIAVTMAQHHPRARPITPAYVDAVDLGTALRVYRERFADAGDFTFVFVGSFSPDSLRPLAERYLATLPAAGRREAPRDVGLRAPTGVIERTVRKGVEPKAQTRLVFTGALASPSRERRFALSMLGEVLELRLRDRLREALGGTYGVQVSAGTQRIPRDEYSVSISFGSAPDRADELTQAVYAELDSLRARGATAEEIAKVRELQTRERETSVKQNAFWLGQLASRAEHGDPLSEILTYDRLLATLTPGLVRDAARAFLDPKNVARFTLRPESGAGTAPVPDSRP